MVASTDAASVFHILGSKKLNLKDNTTSMLELESGSNDPMSYMLTIVMVSLMGGEQISVPLLLFRQLAFGIVCGLVIGKLAVFVLNNVSVSLSQGGTILVFAAAILSYAFADGNRRKRVSQRLSVRDFDGKFLSAAEKEHGALF